MGYNREDYVKIKAEYSDKYAKARRAADVRCDELHEKGIDAKYEDVLAEMNERDKNDSSRKIAPAVPAKDAVMLDNSGFTPDETYNAALDIIKSKVGGSF